MLTSRVLLPLQKARQDQELPLYPGELLPVGLYFFTLAAYDFRRLPTPRSVEGLAAKGAGSPEAQTIAEAKEDKLLLQVPYPFPQDFLDVLQPAPPGKAGGKEVPLHKALCFYYPCFLVVL